MSEVDTGKPQTGELYHSSEVAGINLKTTAGLITFLLYLETLLLRENVEGALIHIRQVEKIVAESLNKPSPGNGPDELRGE